MWIVAFLSLPETSREVVGTGSTSPRAWNKSVMYLIRQPWTSHGTRPSQSPSTSTTTTSPQKISKTITTTTAAANPLRSLALFRDKETSLLLGYSGVIYASSSMVLSTLPD